MSSSMKSKSYKNSREPTPPNGRPRRSFVLQFPIEIKAKSDVYMEIDITEEARNAYRKQGYQDLPPSAYEFVSLTIGQSSLHKLPTSTPSIRKISIKNNEDIVFKGEPLAIFNAPQLQISQHENDSLMPAITTNHILNRTGLLDGNNEIHDFCETHPFYRRECLERAAEISKVALDTLEYRVFNVLPHKNYDAEMNWRGDEKLYETMEDVIGEFGNEFWGIDNGSILLSILHTKFSFFEIKYGRGCVINVPVMPTRRNSHDGNSNSASRKNTHSGYYVCPAVKNDLIEIAQKAIQEKLKRYGFDLLNDSTANKEEESKALRSNESLTLIVDPVLPCDDIEYFIQFTVGMVFYIPVKEGKTVALVEDVPAASAGTETRKHEDSHKKKSRFSSIKM